MKGMMLKEYGQRFAMVELDQPPLGPTDVLLKVKACGICGTDVKIRDGLVAAPIVVLPHVPGHEVAGEVVEVGSEVADFHPGDRVTVYLLHNLRRVCALSDRPREPVSQAEATWF